MISILQRYEPFLFCGSHFKIQKIALSFLPCNWFVSSFRAISASAPIFAYTGMNNCEVYQSYFLQSVSNRFCSVFMTTVEEMKF